MKKKCKKCGAITEHHPTDGYCLECDDKPYSKALLRWIRQYKEWTGDENWEYNREEYLRVAAERMYRMAVDGVSISDIASALTTPRSQVRSLVLRYCTRNNLETPFKKHKIVRRKPRIVRQCPVCRFITETYEGSGYETVCKGCTNFPEDSRQRTEKWIARENERAEYRRERRDRPYESPTITVSTQFNDEIFFGYLKVDFDTRIITPIGKKAEDMYEIVWDLEKVWEKCNPMWPSFKLPDGKVIDSRPMLCPIHPPSLMGPNGISNFLAPLEDWEISVDLNDWWFDMQGELVTFLSMEFSGWLSDQYIEKSRTIEEIAEQAGATTYSIEYALNELFIPLRDRETFQ